MTNRPTPPATRHNSHPQHLHLVIKGDRQPVGLRGAPLQLVDLGLGRVGEDGVLDGPRHLLNVPDQRLVVVACRKQNVRSMAAISTRGASYDHSRQPCHVKS